MPNTNLQFEGQPLILPGAYVANDVTTAFQSAPATTPPLVFLGYGYGGAPNTAYNFVGAGSAQALLSFIRGGPASGFVPFLTSPSPSLFGAQNITFINVGQNTQSSLGVSSTGVAGMQLISANYGSPSNLLQCTIGTGTNVGKKITIFDGYQNLSLVGDNIGVPFQLAYTGTATGGISYNVGVSGFNAQVMTVTSPNTGESVSIPLTAGNYSSISQVVEYLNGTGFYSAVAFGYGNQPASTLDSIGTTTLSPLVSGVPQYSNITAQLGSALWWFNNIAQTFATATVSGASSYVASQALANIPATSFSGAASIPPTNNSYASGFNLAATIPGWVVFADSNTPAVQLLGEQHAFNMSQPSAGRWRRFFTGSSAGDSVATTISNAQALGSNSTNYVFPGIYYTNTTTGVNGLLGGLYGAAAAAAMATGNQVNTPLTNKPITATGVELPGGQALSLSQIDQLQQAGVMVLYTPSGTNQVTIASDLTTWQTDTNPENVFSQQVANRWFLNYTLQNSLQPYAGTVASTVSDTIVYSAVVNALNASIYTPGSNGVINSWDASSLKLVYTGSTQSLAITVNVILVGQNRFITVTTTIQPLNLVITGSTISTGA